jgi:hypothetical protein
VLNAKQVRLVTLSIDNPYDLLRFGKFVGK